jgi:intein/homing endonuclease
MWSRAVELFTRVFYHIDFKHVDTILINYNNVRPYGEPLKTFGGQASGHGALQTIIEKISKIMLKNNNDYKKLTSVDAMDIVTIIAEGIVVGGTRRSATMCLSSDGDTAMMNSKMDLYKQNSDGEWIANKNMLHRMMSNNSTLYWSKPSLEELKKRFEIIKHSSENNFFNGEQALQRFESFAGSNPSMPKDVMVQTTNGIFNINELEGKTFKVKTLDGSIADAKCWMSGENEEVFEINFGGDRTTYATAQHKFPTIDDNGYLIRKKVSELKIGDRVPLNRNELQGYSNEKYTYEDGLLAGIIIGDGSLGKRKDYNNFNYGSFTVNDDDPEIKNFIDRKHKEITGKLPVWYKRKEDGNFLECNFKATFVDYLIDTLKLSYSKDGKKIPNYVWTAGDNFVLGLINGLFSTDGSASLNNKNEARVTFVSSEYNLVKDIQKLLSFYGVTSVLKTRKTSGNFPNGKDYNKIYTSNELDINGRYIHLFNNIFTLISKRKQDVINNIANVLGDSMKHLYVKNISKRGREKVWDISVNHEQHVFPSQHVYTGNCGEILLDDHEFCNLVTIVTPSFIENGALNKEKLLEAQRLNTRISYRITLPTLELPKWDKKQKRDRLLGLSLTGWQDMVNKLDMSIEEQKELLKELRQVAWEEMERYADLLGLSHSKLITSVKPEGTLSQLPTVSSGVHMSHSPYYLRRVRINSDDPLVKVCEDLGYPIYPEVGQDEDSCTTKVIEFPVKAPEGKTKYNVSAIEQLEIYKMFMENYVDHNASNTISVKDDEWEDVVEWVYNNWDSMVGITFISLDNSFYQLMPYESITKEEYEKRTKNMKRFNQSLLQKYEKKETELDIGDDGCESGICPIR